MEATSGEEGGIAITEDELARLKAGYTAEAAAKRLRLCTRYFRTVELHGSPCDKLVIEIRAKLGYSSTFLGRKVTVPIAYYRALKQSARVTKKSLGSVAALPRTSTKD